MLYASRGHDLTVRPDWIQGKTCGTIWERCVIMLKHAVPNEKIHFNAGACSSKQK